MIRPLLESHSFKHIHCLSATLFPCYVLIEQWQCHIVKCCFIRNEIKRLENETYRSASILCCLHVIVKTYRLAVYIVIATVMAIKHSQYVKQCGFTRARCPH